MSKEIDEREFLLPWKANGSLTEQEREAVELFLKENPDRENDIAFYEALRASVKSADFGSPGAFGLRRLQNEISESNNTDKIMSTVNLPATSANDTSWWRMSLAAAVLVVVVQGGVMFNMMSNQDSYQPLGVEVQDAITFQVEFVSSASAIQISEVLTGLNLSIVSGPSAIGLYQVRLDVEPDDTAAIDMVLVQLQQSTNVISYAEKN